MIVLRLTLSINFVHSELAKPQESPCTNKICTLISYRLAAIIAVGIVAVVAFAVLVMPPYTIMEFSVPDDISVQLSKVELSTNENANRSLLVEFSIRNDNTIPVNFGRLQYALFASQQPLGNGTIQLETLGIGRNIITIQPNDTIKVADMIEPNTDLTKLSSPYPVVWTSTGKVRLSIPDTVYEKNFTTTFDTQQAGKTS